jgi:hypothetical protein
MVKGRSRAAGAMLLAATLGLTGCNSGAKTAPELQSTVRPGVAPTPSAKGAYFGAWVPPERPGKTSASPTPRASAEAAGRVPAVSRFEKEMGRQLDITATYRSWKQPFPEEADTALVAGNRQLLLNWHGADTREIVAGKYDQHIRERARAVKALGKPVFLRWQRDMDRSELRVGRIHSAAAFIAAWRHLRRIFREERADNVAWVWSPSLRGMTGGTAEAFYPGDAEVDWIATDVFPSAAHDYRDFADTVGAFMTWARERPKPIMIAEFGVPRSYAGRRAEWLRETAQFLQDPQIKAVVYFDDDVQGVKGVRKRRYAYSLAGDRAALSGLRELATTPYFNPRSLPVTPG